MAEKVQTIITTIQEARSSSELVLLKVSELLNKEQRPVICTCDCHNMKREGDFVKLQDRLSELEVRETQKNEEIFQMRRTIHELREVVFMLRHECLKNPLIGDTSPDNPHSESKLTQDKPTISDKDPPYKYDKGNISNDDISFKTSKESAHSSQDQEISGEFLKAGSVKPSDRPEVLRLEGMNNRMTVAYCSDNSASFASSTSENNNNSLSDSIASQRRELGDGQQETTDTPSTQEQRRQQTNVKLWSHGQTDKKLTKPPNVTRDDEGTKTASTKRSFKKVPVIHQANVRRTPIDTWRFLGGKEQFEGSQSEVQLLEGIHTALLVDISESMAGAWSQVQTFVYDYLDGLEELRSQENFNEEYVSLIVFGHETRVTRATKDIQHIRRKFESIIIGGPSPMFGGVMFAVAAAESNSRNALVGLCDMKVVPKRVVLISDFNPTETELSAGPDIADPAKQDETMCHMMDVIEQFPRSGKELICVPVGEANMTMAEQLTSISGGRQWRYQDGRRFARRFYVLKHSLGSVPDKLLESIQDGSQARSSIDHSRGVIHIQSKIQVPGRDPKTQTLDSSNQQPIGLTEDDMDLFKEALHDVNKSMAELNDMNRYTESDNSSLPKIGSRVKRGPDWEYPNQDSFGPGTVIGHAPGDRLHVEWDFDGHRNIYRYGKGRKYDVLLVDEPRVIRLYDRLAVGCLVLPGPDWHHGYDQVKQDEEGVVIRILGSDKFNVKWTGGHRGDYIYKIGTHSELKLATIGSTEPTLQKPKLKNKNSRISKR